jgi:hypothetical protein
LSSGWLAYAGEASNASGTPTTTRLDSAYTFADVNSLRRYSLGAWAERSRVTAILSIFATGPRLGVAFETGANAYRSKSESAPVIFGVVTLASIPGPPLMPTVYGMEWLHVTETAGVAFAAE